jgi:hypothetical protein
MRTDKLIDAAIDAYQRVRVGEEYVMGSSMRWAELRRRWDVFMAYVALIDDAVADPFSDGAAILLSTARSLTSESAHEMGDLLSQAGDALLWKIARTPSRR